MQTYPLGYKQFDQTKNTDAMPFLCNVIIPGRYGLYVVLQRVREILHIYAEAFCRFVRSRAEP